MPITIASNIASLGAQRQLGKVTESLGGTFERLSSGLRINKASDDAAGLAIAATLNADSRIFTQAIRNLSDGTSLLSISEGALKQLSEIVIRQTELAEQSANGTYSLTQRAAMQTEVDALSKEQTRIVRTTSFNGIRILDDNASSIYLQAGAGDNTILKTDSVNSLRRTVGDGTFAQQSGLSTGESGGIWSVDTADFNGDGFTDIISTNPSSELISIFYGNNDGTFQAEVTIGFSGENVYGISVHDFNNDGRADIATANYPDNTITIGLNNGSGGFNLTTVSTGSSDVFRLDGVGDLNGDGIADIAAGNFSSGGVMVMFGNSNGSFSNPFQAISGVSPVAYIADLDNNGVNELITSVGSTTQILNYNNSLGTFTVSQTINVDSASISIADFNRDGRKDLFFTKSAGEFQVWQQTASGTFNHSVTFDYGSNGTGSDVADFNGDGYLDIVHSGTVTDFINVILGNGDGTFKAPISQASGNDPWSVKASDLNGDGVADIVTGSATADSTGIQIHFSNVRKTAEAEMFDIMTQATARQTLDKLRSSLDRINSQLGEIGSSQSRLTVATNNLRTSNENYLSAASRIMDVDVAQESAELTRQNILQQAAASVLGQANQQPQLALQLLRG
jgi:flagellin